MHRVPGQLEPTHSRPLRPGTVGGGVAGPGSRRLASPSRACRRRRPTGGARRCGGTKSGRPATWGEGGSALTVLLNSSERLAPMDSRASAWEEAEGEANSARAEVAPPRHRASLSLDPLGSLQDGLYTADAWAAPARGHPVRPPGPPSRFLVVISPDPKFADPSPPTLSYYARYPVLLPPATLA